MDKKTVFIKTPKGEREAADLSGDLKRIMSLIDNKSTVDELNKRAPPSLRESLHDVLNDLVAGEYIRDKDKPLVEPKIATPKITPPKMFVPKPTAAPPSEELDFTSMSSVPLQKQVEQAAQQQANDAARGRAELEAAVAAAKAKASAEAEAKAEAKARKEAEVAARARAEAEAKAKHETAIREQAEAKAKQEAAARMQAEQVAARAKAELEAVARAKAEAEARVRAEIEAAARAKQEAEAKAKREAEAARLKAEQEAARIKAELEAAAKAKAEAEAARIKAEQEAERVRAELAAAKARAEAEAKALAEARARQEAEARARQEAEARARQEAEARARQEAEARARQEAEARIRAEAEVKAQREAEQQTYAESAVPIAAETAPAAFEIDLNSFLGDGVVPVAQPSQPAVDHAARERAEAESMATREAEQRAAAEAKAEAEKKSKANMAAEMARMKAEAEAAQRKAEEEARRKAEEQALSDEQAKAWAEAEERAKVQAKIEAEQMAQQAALSQAKVSQKAAPRVRRAPLPVGKIAAGLVVLALVALVALPYVYPLQEFIAPLEQRLSAQLKQPVRIAGMSAASLPPKLQLQNVTVGAAQEVKVGSVVLNFDLLSLISDIKVISNAELQDVSIDGRVLDKQMASLKYMGGDKQYPVRHLTLQRVKFVTDEIALPVFSGVADIDAQGGFSRVSLHSADDKYSFDLLPNQGRWQLALSLKETSLPLLPDIVFSDLNAKGDISDGEVNFTEVDGHVYNGILLGNAKLNWRKGWQLQGHLEAKTFELNRAFPKYGIEGEFFGEGTFILSGAKLSQLGDMPRLEGSFTLKKGVVNGIDMVETARLASRENLVGGRTHFDDMIGTAVLENHASHFRQLKIVSGMLSANGSFDVAPDKQLTGSFNAEVKMRAGNNQLTLFGALGEPKLRAGR